MDKPSYDYEALKEAIRKCDQNIVALQEGIKKEKTYKVELRGYLRQHDKWRKQQSGN